MLEYLYTTNYTDAYGGLNKFSSCKHPNDSDCSFADEKCCLRPYGIAIALYAMGDKYIIPGLMTFASISIQKMLKCVGLRGWKQEFEVWTLMYKHSRASDELREILLARMHEEVSENRAIVGIPGFLEFLKHSPELLFPLLTEIFKPARNFEL